MKFSGFVGFWEGDEEVRDSVYEPVIKERYYVGDVHQYRRQFQSASNQQNDNLVISTKISILSDLYARQNWHSIRYIVWNGVRWTCRSVELNYPRIELEIGEVYYGKDTRDVGSDLSGNYA